MKLLKIAVCIAVSVFCSASTPAGDVFEVPTVSSIASTALYANSEYYIYVDGYTTQGDGGVGYLFSPYPGVVCGSANNGTVVQDSSGYCYYRANPTNDVREWGAKCDVVALSNSINNVHT